MKWILISIFIVSCSSTKQLEQANEASILIKNIRIVTGTGSIHENASLLIKGNKIISINDTRSQESAKTVIDGSGKTVMPGLIDAHAHIFFSPRYPLQIKSEAEMNSFLATDLPKKLQEYLDIGVTTLFSPGDYWPYIKTVKDDLIAERIRGPRMYISGPIFTATGGHPAVTVCDGSPWCREHLSREITNISEARKVITEIASDVDAIKIVYDDGRRVKYNQLNDSLVSAIIHIGHEHRLPVYAHTPSDSRAIRLIEAGVDGLVHAPVQSAEDYPAIKQALLKKKIAVSSTLSVLAPFPSDSGTHVTYFGAPYPPQMEERLKTALQNTADAINNNILLAFGTDTPMQPSGISFYKELEMFRQMGIPNLHILTLLTNRTAIFLKKEHLIGTIETNKLADLVIVSGNPVENLDHLKNVWLVIKDGKIVVDKR